MGSKKKVDKKQSFPTPRPKSCAKLDKTKEIGRIIFKNPKVKDCAVFSEDNKSAIVHNDDLNKVPLSLQRFNANKVKSLDNVVLDADKKTSYLACSSVYNKKKADDITTVVGKGDVNCGKLTPIVMKGSKEKYTGFVHPSLVGFGRFSLIAKTKDYNEIKRKRYSKSELGKKIGLTPSETKKKTKSQLIMGLLEKRKKTNSVYLSDYE